MKKVFFFAALAATVSMTSCNNDDETIDNTPVEIRLSSGITAQTRAAFSDTDKQIIAGRTVSVYVDDAKPPTTPLYGNNELTANGGGGFTGTAMYFPQTGNAVDIYAFHTNATLDATFPTAAISHTVSADQTAPAGYVASDLLYASSKEVVRTKSNVELTFYHLLSKVQVAVVAGDGLVDTDIANVEILGTLPTAEFIPAKDKNANEQAITASGAATAIQIGKDISTDFSGKIKYNDAIIVPQDVAAGNFIQITLSKGGTLAYTLPATTFESGKKYIYNITANLTKLTVTSTIENWQTVGGSPTTGTAVMN